MNSAGNGIFLNIYPNIDDIKKIQLISHYYNASLADMLNFSQLKCHLVLVKYNHIFLGEICIYPSLI